MLTHKPIFRPPLAYYGWKQNLVGELLKYIPEHKTFVESHFGGGALFRSKKPSQSEIINDINGLIIHFYKILKSNYKELNNMIKSTLHSRLEYKKALFIYQNPHLYFDHPVLLAWSVYVTTNMWFLHRIGSRGFDKSKAAKGFANKTERFKQELSERLRYTQIECDYAHKVITSRDSESTLFFCDPPYVWTHLGHYKYYTEQDFITELNTLTKIKGKFMLCNFPSQLLMDYIKANNRHYKTFDKPLSASYKNWGAWKRKTEILVSNFPLLESNNPALACDTTLNPSD